MLNSGKRGEQIKLEKVDLGSVLLLKRIDSEAIHVCFFEIFITPEPILSLHFRPR